MNYDLDPDRRLALAYVPARARPAVEALWRLDVTFGGILAAGRDPMVSRLRLAWWREALEALDRAPAPAEPLLRALAAHVLPAGIKGVELARMEEGWALLLSPEALTDGEQARYAALRGGLLFELSARLLGAPGFAVAPSGENWALVDLARHSSGRDSVRLCAPESHGKWPFRLRPLGMLAILAKRDVDRLGKQWERQGSPGRMLRMIRHRLTGN
ncbi:MAG TPA: squalene/phytoene synthase family protein [Allosphingosinicella sp.]|nr:squalene/phytoene synthase family protein [Allosphingosinicella sp.]